MAQLPFALLCAVIGFVLGDKYISRLPNHAGYFLVAVDDEVHVPIPTRPRHTLVIVVDGLRLDAAEKMKSTRLLRDAGQCRVSDQGTYTVSRPVYSLLSTGIEVDRAGSRNNDLSVPLAAESVWQVARASGLRVHGSSHLPWFRQLFPDGWDSFYVARAHEDNVFDVGDDDNNGLVDINLVHPLYVDEAGHQHGGASPEYAAAVARADREIGALLDRIDLTRDTVILTADHGHRNEGGHGGAQPEIRNVLACFAGVNVAKRAERGWFDGRSTGPLLAVLVGVRFPRQMRAGDDGLDVLWDIATCSDAAYLADRRAAVAKYREANRAALEQWLGSSPGTWPRMYERGESEQTTRAIVVAIAAAALLGWRVRQARRRYDKKAAVLGAVWIALALFMLWCAHHLLLGDFDFTVINLRVRYLPRAFGAVFLSAALAIAVHAVVLRRAARLLEVLASDALTLVALLLITNVGHIYVYGWPLGFPLPPAAARYFPFLGSIALLGYALVALVVVLLSTFVTWRRSKG